MNQITLIIIIFKSIGSRSNTDTVLLKGKYQKKMSLKIRQWISSPKYILTLKSYDPKFESGLFLKCQIITIFQKRKN